MVLIFQGFVFDKWITLLWYKNNNVWLVKKNRGRPQKQICVWKVWPRFDIYHIEHNRNGLPCDRIWKNIQKLSLRYCFISWGQPQRKILHNKCKQQRIWCECVRGKGQILRLEWPPSSLPYHSLWNMLILLQISEV